MIDKNYKAGTQKGSANYDAVITLIATPKGKFPPQAGIIIEALLAAKGNTLTVGELVGTDGSTESALDKAGLNVMVVSFGLMAIDVALPNPGSVSM